MDKLKYVCGEINVNFFVLEQYRSTMDIQACFGIIYNMDEQPRRLFAGFQKETPRSRSHDLTPALAVIQESNQKNQDPNSRCSLMYDSGSRPELLSHTNCCHSHRFSSFYKTSPKLCAQFCSQLVHILHRRWVLPSPVHPHLSDITSHRYSRLFFQ